MDTSAPATPRTAPTSGESPGAKRPARRTGNAADTPAPTREMTMQETTHALQRIMAQQANDAVWGETVITALDDHSRRLDVEKNKTRFLNYHVKMLTARLENALKVIEDNDTATKMTIEEEASTTKRIIEECDMATKKILEDNDKRLKDIISVNDDKVKAAIESLSTSLDATLRADVKAEIEVLKNEMKVVGDAARQGPLSEVQVTSRLMLLEDKTD